MVEIDLKKCGNFIKERRCSKSLTQSELAEIMGLSRAAISRWETGNGLPSIEMIDKLARILEITLDEIVKGEFSEKRKQKNNL